MASNDQDIICTSVPPSLSIIPEMTTANSVDILRPPPPPPPPCAPQDSEVPDDQDFSMFWQESALISIPLRDSNRSSLRPDRLHDIAALDDDSMLSAVAEYSVESVSQFMSLDQSLGFLKQALTLALIAMNEALLDGTTLPIYTQIELMRFGAMRSFPDVLEVRGFGRGTPENRNPIRLLFEVALSLLLYVRFVQDDPRVLSTLQLVSNPLTEMDDYPSIYRTYWDQWVTYKNTVQPFTFIDTDDYETQAKAVYYARLAQVFRVMSIPKRDACAEPSKFIVEDGRVKFKRQMKTSVQRENGTPNRHGPLGKVELDQLRYAIYERTFQNEQRSQTNEVIIDSEPIYPQNLPVKAKGKGKVKLDELGIPRLHSKAVAKAKFEASRNRTAAIKLTTQKSATEWFAKAYSNDDDDISCSHGGHNRKRRASSDFLTDGETESHASLSLSDSPANSCCLQDNPLKLARLEDTDFVYDAFPASVHVEQFSEDPLLDNLDDLEWLLDIYADA